MISDFFFIDKTLGYALKNKQISTHKFALLKQKISEMSKMIFDIPLDYLKDNEDLKNTELKDVRVCIESRIEQVKAAHDLGYSWIKVSCSHFLKEETLFSCRDVLSEANLHGMKVTIGCFDISDKSQPGMDIFQKLNNEYKIHSVIVHDCDSRLDPLTTYWMLEDMKKRITCNMEYGGKNALGLATGNTLGAIKSGINTVATSVGGIGGFPALEEVVMSARHLFKIPVSVPQNIALYCQEVLECLGIDIPKTKPVIGSNIFAHESGIHVDGVIKKSELYEPFTPEEVGLSRKIVIGKHSGKAAIEQKVKELNISLKPPCIELLLARVRSLAIKQKAAVVDEQLEQLAKEVVVCEGVYC